MGDLAFQATLGAARKEARYQEIFSTFQATVDSTPGLRWRTPRSWDMAGILTAVQLSTGDVSRVSEALLRDHGIVVRAFPEAGLNSLRVSPNLMNTETELERLLALLQRSV